MVSTLTRTHLTALPTRAQLPCCCTLLLPYPHVHPAALPARHAPCPASAPRALPCLRHVPCHVYATRPALPARHAPCPANATRPALPPRHAPCPALPPRHAPCPACAMGQRPALRALAPCPACDSALHCPRQRCAARCPALPGCRHSCPGRCSALNFPACSRCLRTPALSRAYRQLPLLPMHAPTVATATAPTTAATAPTVPAIATAVATLNLAPLLLTDTVYHGHYHCHT
ncbi:unnamed protein product [Closterium sp. NIES-54]